MKSMKHWGGGLLAAGLLLGGCDRAAQVDNESKDLQQAQQEAPRVANDLQKDLDSAKAEVVRLEQKVAMAKEGVTDDVLKERDELKEALKKEDQHVRQEVNEAQGAARELNADSERAKQQLQQTQPQHVEARVKTETQVVPSTSTVQVTKEQVQVPIDRTQVTESGRAQGKGATTTSTTASPTAPENGAR
jgi:transcription elongation GreA/GreB family factor